jgi:hypothetical protein
MRARSAAIGTACAACAYSLPNAPPSLAVQLPPLHKRIASIIACRRNRAVTRLLTDKSLIQQTYPSMNPGILSECVHPISLLVRSSCRTLCNQPRRHLSDPDNQVCKNTRLAEGAGPLRKSHATPVGTRSSLDPSRERGATKGGK